MYLTEVMVLGNEVTVFLTFHNGSFVNWRCALAVSRDNGYTWQLSGAPRHLPAFTFYRGLIRLRNGDVAIAYQH